MQFNTTDSIRVANPDVPETVHYKQPTLYAATTMSNRHTIKYCTLSTPVDYCHIRVTNTETGMDFQQQSTLLKTCII